MDEKLKLAFIGLQGSGKTTALEAAGMALPRYESYMQFKFAQPIYDVLAAIEKPKHRLFMQQFSDLAKEHFGLNIFNEIARKRIQDYINEGYHILCDDVRFEAEVDLLKEFGFSFFYVETAEEKRKARIGHLFRNPSHNSEAQVAGLSKECPLTVVNNGRKDEFIYAVQIACGLKERE